LRFALRETIIGFRRAPMLSVLSITTIAFSLFAFGLFSLVAVNIRKTLRDVESRVEIRAFLADGTSVETVSAAMSDIGACPEVSRVEYVSRDSALARARAEHKAGRLSAGDLRRAEDAAIRDVARMQEELGLQGITDGEFRRSSWHMDFLYQIGGVRKVQQNITVHFHSDQGDVDFKPSGIRVEGKLSLDGCIFGDHFDYLKSVVKHGTPKLTIPSPSMMHYRGGRAAIDP
jgi:hypothetical protein